jgi:hypothetical protein
VVDFLSLKEKMRMAGLLCLLMLSYLLQVRSAFCAEHKDISIMHLKQVHRCLGVLDVYFDAHNLKCVNDKGDLSLLWRKDLQAVYVLNPIAKLIHKTSQKDFLAYGFLLTGNSPRTTCSLELRNRRNIKFLMQKAISVEVCGESINRRPGPKRFVHCQDLVGLATTTSPEYEQCVAVLTVMYGMAVHEFVPLKCTCLYEPRGGEVWFQTDVGGLRSGGEKPQYVRVNTFDVQRETVAENFFAVPDKGYKFCASEAEVIGSSEQAKDFSQMLGK